MVKRRTTHARHARAGASAKRRQEGGDKAVYVGGTSPFGQMGGRVGNIAGLGSDDAQDYHDGMPSIGNVAGYGQGSTDVKAGGAHRRTTPAGGNKAPTPRAGGDGLLSRRAFLYGAAGVGAAAVVGGGAALVVSQAGSDDEEEVPYLEVPESAVWESEDFTEVDYADILTLTASYELPYGTLAWVNDDAWAALLLPCETSDPLAQVALLSLSSGESTTVLTAAVGAEEGFQVYDARATSSGLVWTEADILDGTWRIYTAALNGTTLGEAVLADEGTVEDWDTPTLAVVGAYAFWQVVPKATSDRYADGTVLRRAVMGSTDVQDLYTSRGRSATPPYATSDAVVITPRVDSSTVYHTLTLLDAESGSELDAMTLPASMTPLEAGHGDTGFTFSFEAIYSYGDGIANMGTYTPASAVEDGAYSDASWFHFNRTPTAAPAWLGPYFIVKSTSQVCGFDFESGEYFAIDTESGCDDYGEYLATTGSCDALVTFTNVDDDPIDGDARQCCVLKVWTAAT